MSIQFRTLFSRFSNRLGLIGKFMHLIRIKKARRVIKKLKEIAQSPNSHGKIIAYLRKINPFVFEELILTVIEDSNIHIIRNKRYTGDGGIDGMFKLPKVKGKVLIQCKRYQSYINQKDVAALSHKVKEGKFHMGIFVHTGKTGDKARDVIKIDNNVIFISGSVLVNLILGELHIAQHLEEKILKLNQQTYRGNYKHSA
jgi:restriction system protein